MMTLPEKKKMKNGFSQRRREEKREKNKESYKRWKQVNQIHHISLIIVFFKE
jgi:hypothetical protein